MLVLATETCRILAQIQPSTGKLLGERGSLPDMQLPLSTDLGAAMNMFSRGIQPLVARGSANLEQAGDMAAQASRATQADTRKSA